jgi:hypothetical protein
MCDRCAGMREALHICACARSGHLAGKLGTRLISLNPRGMDPHGNTSWEHFTHGSQAVSMRAMQPLYSLDSDVRYFDGVLAEVEDDLLGLYDIDDEVLRIKQVSTHYRPEHVFIRQTDLRGYLYFPHQRLRK